MATQPRVINADYGRFERLSETERRGVFQAAADSHGAFVQAMEKDYWVCRVIDVLFKGMSKEPKLYFKGGTSLSKGYSLIHRFSEDIDIVTSRAALMRRCTLNPDDPTLSENQRKKAIAEMSAVCREFVFTKMRAQLEPRLPNCTFEEGGDTQEHELRVLYQPLFEPYGYQKQYVRIECSAKGDGEPSEHRSISPYIQEVLPNDEWALGSARVSLILPERTLLEKIFILHFARCRFDNDGSVPGNEKYPSRHYYDVARMHAAGLAVPALRDRVLLESVIHNQKTMWFANKSYLQLIRDEKMNLLATAPMRQALVADYENMKGMMFVEIPEFDWVEAQLADLQAQVPTALKAAFKSNLKRISVRRQTSALLK